MTYLFQANTKISNKATNLGGTGREAWYTNDINDYGDNIDYSLAEDNYVIYGMILKEHDDG